MNYNICRCIVSELGFSKIVNFRIFCCCCCCWVGNLVFGYRENRGESLLIFVRVCVCVFLGIFNSMESNNSNSMRAVVVWMVLKLVEFLVL